MELYLHCGGTTCHPPDVLPAPAAAAVAAPPELPERAASAAAALASMDAVRWMYASTFLTSVKSWFDSTGFSSPLACDSAPAAWGPSRNTCST
eukprot:6886732-Pyramimonas_sp.AAC.1